MENSTETIRKRILYRSRNRGCRETDILLGRFAESQITSLPEAELPIFEQFLEEPDGYIYKWLTGTLEMPPEYRDNIGSKLLKFINEQL